MKKTLLILMFISTLIASAQYSGGTGTATDPYQIATLTDLESLSANNTDWGKNFIQTANIDAVATSGWDSGAGFNPIGNATTDFSGSYNGNNKTITELTINRNSNVGLFGNTNSDAKLSNVGIVAVNLVTGSGFAGGLVADNSATIISCYVTGSVKSDDNNSAAGGLVGFNNGLATNCFATASVSGVTAGGLVGINFNNITNSFAAGLVSGTYKQGGLIGYYGGGYISSSFYDQETSSQNDTGKGEPKTTAQMKTQNTFVGWDFVGETINGDSDTWTMDVCNTDGSSYPVFTSTLSLFPSGGEGTVANPYKIATLNDLKTLSKNSCLWDKNFIQTANIDAAATSNWNDGGGFRPIGDDYHSSFSGSYNGQGYTISGLYVNYFQSEYIGLFARTMNSAKLSNIGLVGCVITTKGMGFAGGLVGYNLGTITNCYVTGSVEGDNYSGGLVANNQGDIINCYVTASVSGDHAGGLVATNAGAVTNCYVIGMVTGRLSYNTGGLVGQQQIAGTVTNSFYNSTTSGQSDTGKGESRTTAQMKIQSTFTDWDFIGESANGTADIWKMGQCSNNGYPVLAYQTIVLLPAAPTALAKTYCLGATATALTATIGINGTGLLWYNTVNGTGTTTAPIPSTTTVGNTSYWVSSTNTTSCESGRTEIVVTVSPTLSASIASQTNVTCNGGVTGASTVAVTGGTAPYAYLWSNGATTATIAGIAAGIYTVTTTDATKCTSVTSVTITEPETLSFSVTTLPDYSYNEAYNQNIVVAGGTGMKTYEIIAGSLPSGITLSSGGLFSGISTQSVDSNFTVRITDANDCTASNDFVLKSNQIAITVTALASQTKIYGSTEPTLEYTVTPSLLTGDTFTGSLSRVIGENVGAYAITKGNLNAGPKYRVNFVSNDFNIIKANQVISWDQVLEFGCESGSNIVLTAKSNSGLAIDYSSSDNTIASVVNGSLILNNYGSTEVTASQAGNMNFNAAANIVNLIVSSQSNLIKQHFEDVIFFDNSSNSFTAYSWYKNGVLVTGQTTQYFKDSGVLNGTYYAIATKLDGTVVRTCELALSPTLVQEYLKIAPNPVRSDSSYQLFTNVNDEKLLNARVTIFNLLGAQISDMAINSKTVDMIAPSTEGVYIVRLTLSNGKVLTKNLLVRN